MRRVGVAVFALLGCLCGAISAKAGPLPPCISATESANGSALVVNELTLGESVGMGQKVEASAFRVYRSYRDLNKGLRLNGPDKYWANPVWKLSFTREKSPFIFCPYALVTDDAEYLVFVGVDINPAALFIYRRDDKPRPAGSVGPPGGVLVRQVSFSDLSPEITRPQTFTDHTLEWYSSGTFSFSADERTLIFTTNDGKRLQISLLTGDVKR